MAKKITKEHLEAYLNEVDRLLMQEYGINLDDADENCFLSMYDEDSSVISIVHYFGKKYDLQRKDGMNG